MMKLMMRLMMRHPSTKTGFTLIELLIVVAIIAILATIALPNFLEAQTRAKVSRVKSDLRTIAVALEAYAVDQRAYIPAGAGLPKKLKHFKPLTTPIPYLSTVPLDLFMTTEAAASDKWSHKGYAYGAMPISNASRWALASNGPDLYLDCNPIEYYPGYSADLFAGRMTGYKYTLYDPTNGTISGGDVFRASDYNNK